jgi:hypothetical protein
MIFLTFPSKRTALPLMGSQALAHPYCDGQVEAQCQSIPSLIISGATYSRPIAHSSAHSQLSTGTGGRPISAQRRRLKFLRVLCNVSYYFRIPRPIYHPVLRRLKNPRTLSRTDPTPTQISSSTPSTSSSFHHESRPSWRSCKWLNLRTSFTVSNPTNIP